MSSIIVAGDVSGAVTISAPSAAGTPTLTLPTTSGTIIVGTAPTGAIVGTTDTQTLTNKTLTSPTITGALMSSMASSVITSGTAVASTSGTSITFTGIPSWVKRITVMFSAVSTTGTSDIIIQIGSGSVTTSGYVSGKAYIQGSTATQIAATNAIVGLVTNTAADSQYGTVILTNVTGNTWVGTAQSWTSNSIFDMSSGGITLGGVLDRVNITTNTGTPTFDAGTINILYE
jgi:hypothetical protein